MTNTPPPTDEDRELIEVRQIFADFVEGEDEPSWRKNILEGFADKHPSLLKVRSLLLDRAKLEDALKDLAEAARNACDARLHTPLIEALAEADYALNRSTDRAT